MGVDGSLVNSGLKHSEFGREGERETFCVVCAKEISSRSLQSWDISSK